MKTLKTLLTLFIALTVMSAAAQSDITGKIVYHNDDETPLPGVELQLFDADNNYIATTFTDDNGDYLFEGLENGTYSVEAAYDAEAGGVDMGDALLILFYLNGLYEFTPIEYVAADVTADGEVTWDDYFFLIINHFIFGEPIPGSDWVFEDITINLGAKEGGDDDDDSKYGSSAGDVAGTWEPGQRTMPLVDASYKNYSLLENQSTNLSVFADKSLNISGAGLVINYPEEFINIESVSTSLSDAEVNVIGNQIRLAWTANSKNMQSIEKGDELITIEATLHQATNESLKFNLSDESHFADAEGAILKGMALELPAVSENKNILTLSQVAPNPVISSSAINFYLAKPAFVEMQLVDLSGRVVEKLASQQFGEGNHSRTLVRKTSFEPGIYMLQFNVNGDEITKTQKIILQ